MLPRTYSDLRGQHGLRCKGCKQILKLNHNTDWYYVPELGKPLRGPYCKWICAHSDFCMACHKRITNDPFVISTQTNEQGDTIGPFCNYQCARRYKSHQLAPRQKSLFLTPAREPNALQ